MFFDAIGERYSKYSDIDSFKRLTIRQIEILCDVIQHSKQQETYEKVIFAGGEMPEPQPYSPISESGKTDIKKSEKEIIERLIAEAKAQPPIEKGAKNGDY